MDKYFENSKAEMLNALDNINDNLEKLSKQYDNIPEPCKQCNNHPSNGGSGICQCTLGLPIIN